MRLLTLITILIAFASTAGIAGGRWTGQQTGDPPFPLPDVRGCWAGVCVFALPLSELAAAFNASPAVMTGSARFIDDIKPPGQRFTLRFDRARTGAHQVFEVNSVAYTLRPAPDNPAPLMVLGDLLAALGPPDGVRIVNRSSTALYYPARSLSISVAAVTTPDETGVLLRADTPVVALTVRNAAANPAQNAVDLTRSVSWSGYGVYRVLPAPSKPK